MILKDTLRSIIKSQREELYRENKSIEREKLHDAKDRGMSYKYSNQDELEDDVAEEVAAKYGISVEELDAIYLKVMAYKIK